MMSDPRLILFEALQPFLSQESQRQIQVNADIVDQRLAERGYMRSLYVDRNRLQRENAELRVRNERQSHRILVAEFKVEALKQALNCDCDNGWINDIAPMDIVCGGPQIYNNRKPCPKCAEIRKEALKAESGEGE